MIVKIKRLNPLAIIPKYAKEGDAGLDLYPVEVNTLIGENESGEEFNQLQVKFGISIEIPKGYVGLIFPRSSIKNYKARLSNSVGVIDSGYRGELLVYFDIPSNKSEFYSKDKAVAQLIIIPYPQIEFEEVNELSDSTRGEGGFGSSNN